MSKQNTSIWRNKHILTLYSNKVPVRSSTAALLWVGCYHLVSAKLCMYSTLKLKMPSVQKKWFFKVLEDKLLVIYRFNAGCLEEHKKNNGIAYGCVTGVKTSKLELRNLWGCRPPHSNYLGIFVRFIRTFTEIITFGKASGHEF